MSRTPHFHRILRPAGPLRGDHVVPGDKSISHRAALLAAFAAGRTRVTGFATSADCQSTLGCLEALGVRVERGESDLVVEGRGRGGVSGPHDRLDAGNSGTTIRLLSGLLAGCDVDVSIAGDASLNGRPMERVARPLRLMGADVQTTNGTPPVSIRGRRALTPIDYTPEVPSAQIKSAVLFAGLAANGVTRVAERVRTRDHSERMLELFGARVASDAAGAIIEGPCDLVASDVSVPGDVSSAAFLFCLALLVPDSDVVVRGIGLNPSRTRLLDVLADLGAHVEVSGVETSSNEPRGDVRVAHGGGLSTRGRGRFELSPDVVAEVIDEVPILAVLATAVHGGIRFTGAGDLRKKESDRIATVADGLRRMGATVRDWDDGFEVDGPVDLSGAEVDSHGDHRIAMAFACAALAARGESTITGADAVDVSFPDFFAHLPEGAVVDASE
jgi:3-phosphoshikimate 1-carboxyvinyltransferase